MGVAIRRECVRSVKIGNSQVCQSKDNSRPGFAQVNRFTKRRGDAAAIAVRAENVWNRVRPISLRFSVSPESPNR